MAFTDIYSAATDDTHVLRKQVAVAIHSAAGDVINEAGASRITPIGWLGPAR